ncbi:MAG TPA: hypothetical protein VF559_08150 [Caulobacteraceae bacterium]|jgi:hypothetical protein
MSLRLIFRALAASAALAVAAVGQAQAEDLAALDATQASSPAETLVLCDATAFLSTRPDLNANVILARRTGRPFERLLPPDFLVGGRFYSETAERLYWTLRREGQVTRDQAAEAQDRLVRPVVRSYYGRTAYLPISFSRDQMKYCHDFARQHGVRGGF